MGELKGRVRGCGHDKRPLYVDGLQKLLRSRVSRQEEMAKEEEDKSQATYCGVKCRDSLGHQSCMFVYTINTLCWTSVKAASILNFITTVQTRNSPIKLHYIDFNFVVN